GPSERWGPFTGRGWLRFVRGDGPWDDGREHIFSQFALVFSARQVVPPSIHYLLLPVSQPGKS
ncbi:MAG TPA: hypothetical protein PKD72_03185, partial [Gemmatales bacterium]|nr:hypothetical protein [Gemmatales bacterium]